MTSTTPDFRCAASSREDHESQAGSAPTDEAWLFVEYAGSWGRQAVAESRLPQEIRDFLAEAGVRVQLIRRYGGTDGPGVRVFAARLGRTTQVWTTVLTDLSELLDLDVAALAAGADPGLTPYDDTLWLVCTNGRRDVCCAALGRPIAGALAARWPEETWETTHLGGHRFAGTMLALPSGVALGRLDAESAVVACRDLAEGRRPSAEIVRGRAGWPIPAQVAELHVIAELGVSDLAAVELASVVDDLVTLAVAGEQHRLTVTSSPGQPRRQSCADLATKPARVYDVASWVRPDLPR